MIPRRHPAALGALAAALLLLTVIATTQATALTEQADTWFVGSDGAATPEQMEHVYRLWMLSSALQDIAPWTLLAGLVAGIGALVLVVLRSRAQAGSASATASREDSAAFSRS